VNLLQRTFTSLVNAHAGRTPINVADIVLFAPVVAKNTMRQIKTLSNTMNERDSIERMFSEIRSYGGNFGDPIVDLVDFNPIDVLKDEVESFQIGAGVGLLVNFASHIDNATYEDASQSIAAEELKVAIHEKYCKQYTSVYFAFCAAFESEVEFNVALSEVYRNHVQENS